MSDKPYTPRLEYQCANSTTHYMGCECHEARRAQELAQRDERIVELEEQLEIAEDWIDKQCNCYGNIICAACETIITVGDVVDRNREELAKMKAAVEDKP